MIAIGIGVFVFIQFIVLAFVLALCRSAARGDKEFERARMSDRHHWSNNPESLTSESNRQTSPNTKPSARLRAPAQNR
jgi:hypothetical protein